MVGGPGMLTVLLASLGLGTQKGRSHGLFYDLVLEVTAP